MCSNAADIYLSICRNLNQTPLRQLEELIKNGTEKIDVSTIYLPRKHFSCLLRFIEERPDIQDLVLDGTVLETDDVKALKDCLLHACVSKLSLRNIKLDASGASTLRQLCMSNPNIVEIYLEGTCVPSSKVDEIQLIVSLNRLNADSLRSSSVVAAKNESSRVDRWQLCREACKLARGVDTFFEPQSARSIIDDFVLSHETQFCDPYFTAENFAHPVSAFETIRWSSYCELDDFQKPMHGADEFRFVESVYYNNACFCAALNALRSYGELTKAFLLKSFSQAGLYVFRLFQDGAITEVAVDDILPCVLSGDTITLVGLNSCCHPFYGALLEKAVAKLRGGYKEIERLSFCDCIELLTGGTTFEINLRARTFNSTISFELLRSLSESNHKLVACLIPRSQREAQACENDGIFGGLPYTVLKADVCRKNGFHYAYLLQVATPFSDKAVRYAFEYEAFKSSVVNGRLVVWMTLEDFAVVFGLVYLTLWSFEDAASEHKTIKEFSGTSAASTESTLFANNSAFLIENLGNGAGGIMVTISSCSSAAATNKAKCLFYRHVELGHGNVSRRYDICDKNAVFQSDNFSGGNGSIFFNLLPREKLQLSIASDLKAAFTVRFSMVENVKVNSCPDAMVASRLISEWNTAVGGKRLSEQIVCLRNTGLECNSHSVVALAQLVSPSPPFPIGFFGWVGESADVVSVSAPQFSSALERSIMTVHSIFFPVGPGECLFILPYCCGIKCPNEFDLTIYSVVEMSRTLFATADFL